MCRLLTFGDRSTFASLFPGLVGAVDRRVDGGHQATRLHYRDEQRVRADHLQRQLSKLQNDARQGQKSVRVALQKLTQCPKVAKRIAAACHPDKCPSELSDVASELFRFVQTNRKCDVD